MPATVVLDEMKQALDRQGGPAFPFSFVTEHNGNGVPVTNEVFVGMTLRDYFAAQALIGMLARYAPYSTNCLENAEFSFRQADAMLKAREGQS